MSEGTSGGGSAEGAARASAPAAPGAAEQRVFEVVGDRPCAKCQFNLSGQVVVREPHYGMLIARCPECGTPAALQEYPFLGKWATRAGYALAVWWLLVMAGLLLGTAGIGAMMSEELARDLARPYSEHVQSAYNSFVAAQGPPNPGQSWPMANQQAVTWWGGQNAARLFDVAGGWSGAISWRALWFAWYMVLAMGCCGVAFSVAAPHARWRGRVVLTLLVAGLGAAFLMLEVQTSARYAYFAGPFWSAWHHLVVPLGGLSLGIAAACFFGGMVAGRPVARRVAVLLLPPRLRGPLGFLWRADGKGMPRTVGRGGRAASPR